MKKTVRFLSVILAMAMVATCLCGLTACNQRAAAAQVSGRVGIARGDAVIYGDLDNDGVVSMKDVLIMRKHISGFVAIDIEAGDVDADGSVTMKDVLLMRRHIANPSIVFPAETKAASSTTAQPTTTKANSNEPLIDFIKGTDRTLGVWWWFRKPQLEDTYLDLLERNQVTEIYYCLGSTMQTSNYRTTFHNFIQKAMAHGMRVFLLDGDPSWVNEPTDDTPTRLSKDIEGCKAFMSEYPADAFAGIHCDVEPKPSEANMKAYVENFLVEAQAVREAGMLLEVDLGCGWWNFGKNIVFNGKTGFFNIVAGLVDTMTMMSYRDTADEIYFLAKVAFDAAKAEGTKIVFGIELGNSGEGDRVDFHEESLSTAWTELKKFHNKLAAETINIPYGYAIHAMDFMANLRWYE